MLPTKPMIAVVDDDSSVVKSLARLLRSAGYAVAPFGSAVELLKSLAGVTFLCLIVDVQMPEMSGFELKNRLRQMGCMTPVLFITAHDSPQARAAACQGDSLGLLVKPFEATALLAALGPAVGWEPSGQLSPRV
jgi:FixJ family two-component response regulator